MTQWYYTQVRKLSDNTFLGWVGWSPQGFLRFNGEESDDPSKDSTVTYVGLETSDGTTVLRAPAYHAHGSAALGGSGDNGYYASWHWGERNGYNVSVDGRGVMRDSNGRVLSVYYYAGSNDATWEANETNAVTLKFAIPVKP